MYMPAGRPKGLLFICFTYPALRRKNLHARIRIETCGKYSSQSPILLLVGGQGFIKQMIA
jgi:hypothetical protein